MNARYPHIAESFDMTAEKLSGERGFIGDWQIGRTGADHQDRTGPWTLRLGSRGA